VYFPAFSYFFLTVECKEGAESPCYVVEGQMSLFSTTAALQDKSAAIEGIKSGCEDDAFGML
jgi:hypothetical protein